MSSDAQTRGNGDLGAVTDEELCRLVQRGEVHAALHVYETACARKGGFRPSSSNLVISLARAALVHGRPHVAGRLLHRFDKLHPDHEAIPVAYLLTARVFMCLSKDEIAVDFLEAIRRRFPSHPAAKEAREALENLSGAWCIAVH